MARMAQRWINGNKFTLLENGEQFFPRVFQVIDEAQREVLIETFILYEDKVGMALHAILLKAAKRGVQIDLTIDAFGSPDLSKEFVSTLTACGFMCSIRRAGCSGASIISGACIASWSSPTASAPS
jgi:cardiolipin synthase